MPTILALLSPPNPDPTFSTINTVDGRKIRDFGSEASVIVVDTMRFASIQNMVEKTLEIKMLGRRDSWSNPIVERGECADETISALAEIQQRVIL
ncbi:hypothetical protein MMC07_009900 [Pseudocyphellaria aurata]|nr:hypothetical protein [Pseudocyphellaria aurata]